MNTSPLLMLALYLAPHFAQAQQKCELKDCIGYGIKNDRSTRIAENNIQNAAVRRKRIATEQPIEFYYHLKAQGKPVIEALIEAGEERLRPILMTTLAMIFGMLPIALASGAGAEIKNGMAWVIIGGLTSSMILTLFVVPSMYFIIEKLITRKNKKIIAQPEVAAKKPCK